MSLVPVGLRVEQDTAEGIKAVADAMADDETARAMAGGEISQAHVARLAVSIGLRVLVRRYGLGYPAEDMPAASRAEAKSDVYDAVRDALRDHGADALGVPGALGVSDAPGSLGAYALAPAGVSDGGAA